MSMSLFKMILKALKNRLKLFLLKIIGKKGVEYGIYQDFRLFLEFTDDSIYVYLGIYEGEETAIIKDIVKPEMIVLDMGAHIGFFTLLMANLVGKDGYVYSFEPNPNVFSRLKKNLEINPDLSGWIEIKKLALGSKETKSNFFCPSTGFEGFGGLKNTKRAPINEIIKVDVVTLDKFIKENNIKKLDFIKMDVEGGEFDIFRGAEYTLNKLRPTILFEAEELNSASYGYRVFELLNYLEMNGYIVKQAGGGHNYIAVPRHM